MNHNINKAGCHIGRVCQFFTLKWQINNGKWRVQAKKNDVMCEYWRVAMLLNLTDTPEYGICNASAAIGLQLRLKAFWNFLKNFLFVIGDTLLRNPVHTEGWFQRSIILLFQSITRIGTLGDTWSHQYPLKSRNFEVHITLHLVCGLCQWHTLAYIGWHRQLLPISCTVLSTIFKMYECSGRAKDKVI